MRAGVSGARRSSLAVAALAWMAFGLYWAHIVALPRPLLPPRFFIELFEIPDTTRPERFFIMLLRESSLLLALFALLGVVLAVAAWRAGARRSSLAAGLSGVAILAVSLVPVAQAYRVAYSEDVPLSFTGYFAGFSFGTDRSPQTVTYAHPSGAGEGLQLDVWQPDGGERGVAERPAIVVVHGGGWRSGTRSQFARWNDWLAGEGYVVFDIDYRLSPPARWREAPADVRCAVGWVKENAARYDVDPERVALMGRSAGGHLALLTAYTEGAPYTGSAPMFGCGGAGYGESSDVAAVAAFYSPTDLTGLSRRGYLDGMGTYLGGSLQTVPERYRNSSPIAHLSADAPPTFLAHGGNDEIVPAGQSELLAGRLRKAGVPYQLVELPWANHTFDFLWGGWGTQIARPTLDEFLSRHLAPGRSIRAGGAIEDGR